MTTFRDQPYCDHCAAYASADPEWPWCWRCGRDPLAPLSGPTNDLGPEPVYVDRVIDQDCGPCRGCGQPFVVQDVGVTGSTARVCGQRGAWKRYHVECWPWAVAATT